MKTLGHVARSCIKEVENEEKINQLLGEKSKGMGWMRKVIRERKEKKFTEQAERETKETREEQSGTTSIGCTNG